jgi:hypothetical protein
MLFVKLFNLKKSIRQTFISKRIVNVVKNNWVQFIKRPMLYNLLLKTNIFYSCNDAKTFILNGGVCINMQRIYDPNHVLNQTTHVAFPFYRANFKFFLRKRRNMIISLQRIKFFKFRAKIYNKQYKNFWAPSSEWIYEHNFLYFYKNSNLEFDIRTFTGIFIYKTSSIQFSNFITMANLSPYMSRSYTWKYII